MSLNNEFRCIGYCAEKPLIKLTKEGRPMATLAVYTRDAIGKDEYINQAHRCVFFGKKAEIIASKADKGRHIHIRGMLRSERIGDGLEAKYYTNIIVEEFKVSPRQSVEAVKDALREMIIRDNITQCDQLGILIARKDKY